MNKRVVFVVLFLAAMLSVNAQNDKGERLPNEEKRISTPFVSASFGWTFPSGDMGKKYKSFIDLNANFGWKMKNNWIGMIEFGFGFGSNNIKVKNEILSGIMTKGNDPFVISGEGSDAGIVAYNRNLSFKLKGGKIIPLLNKYPNSGLIFMLGGGFLQHQIIYQATLAKAPQLEGDYHYLYDRQMRGVVISGFLGYIHLGKTNYTNFYIGVEIEQAFTKLTREYQINFNDDYKRINQDRMVTIKLGWMFPFYGRETERDYFY